MGAPIDERKSETIYEVHVVTDPETIGEVRALGRRKGRVAGRREKYGKLGCLLNSQRDGSVAFGLPIIGPGRRSVGIKLTKDNGDRIVRVSLQGTLKNKD